MGTAKDVARRGQGSLRTTKDDGNNYACNVWLYLLQYAFRTCVVLVHEHIVYAADTGSSLKGSQASGQPVASFFLTTAQLSGTI